MDISSIFLGKFESNNDEIKAIKKEIFDIDYIPTPSSDKENLRNDLNVFLKDTRKVEKEIKDELTYG